MRLGSWGWNAGNGGTGIFAHGSCAANAGMIAKHNAPTNVIFFIAEEFIAHPRLQLEHFR